MFETLKSWFITLIALLALGGLGYFAFSSIDSGSEYVSNQKLEDLKKENEDLRKQVETLEKKIETYEPKLVESNPPTETQNTNTNPTQVAQTDYKHANLIKELEDLVRDNINMKLKSRGTRVGTVQNFLNLYNNTSNKVDNDYGESTKRAVSAFQKAVGLTADGEAGPSTFNKMIEWLKKQG